MSNCLGVDQTEPLRCDTIWRDARLARCLGGEAGIAEVCEGLVACREGRIVFAGPASESPRFEPERVVECEGRLITPGLIDCHTHLVYAGSRADEFERRLRGESYEEIARAGGGILSTVRATREATETELRDQSLPRLDSLISEGVTTVEIKSGYGLTLADEMKQLRVARGLENDRSISVTTTLLGAHALPPEFAGRPDDYIDLVCTQFIPAVAEAELADAVDAFCEGIGFTPDQVRRVFDAARRHGLPVKLHAEQLSNSGGAALSAGFEALSADHLEHLDDAGVDAMAAAGMVAVLLPGAFYATRETRRPPIEGLRDRGVPLALATDCNPGTSPLTSLLLAMNMGATLFRMTVEECLLAVTINAARALDLAKDRGSLEPGKRCDLSIWNVERPAELVYRIGFNPLHERVWRGR